MPNTKSGTFGEDIAAAHLEQHGFRVVARNFRTRFGEIDLIATDERYLVFVEVKTRAANARVSAAEAVTPAKQAKLRMAAEEYLAKHVGALPSVMSATPNCVLPHNLHPRFDVICIETAQNGQVAAIRWIENAF